MPYVHGPGVGPFFDPNEVWRAAGLSNVSELAGERNCAGSHCDFQQIG
jgi:hypothetical protein